MKKKTKVIFLINEISDGGAETLVKDYALKLKKEEFDIFIVTEIQSDSKSANYQTLCDERFKIYSPFFNLKSGFLSHILVLIQNIICSHAPEKYINAYKKWYISRLIQRIKPNIIHSHMTVLKYLVPCAPKLKGVKLFYTCHSLPHNYFNKNECKEELDAAVFLIKNFSLTLIGLHREMQNELNTLFNINNSVVIHNGVDLDRFYNIRKNKERNEVRKNLSVPQNAFVLGHVGRFVWIKNQSFIVDVFCELLEKKENAFLLLVGNGDSSKISHKLNQKGLKEKYLILSNRQDIPEILLCMNAFIFPSYFEGFPLACIEAQAMGLKCLISDTVTKDVFFDKNAIPISLNYSAKFWADAILAPNMQGPYLNNINEFDLKTVLHHLCNLYER